MISEIRSYFNQQIKLCNADYKEIRDPLNTDDISLSLIEQNYKLLIGETTTEAVGNFFNKTVAVTLEIYKKAGYDELNDYDEAYTLAEGIEASVIDPLIVKNSTSFSDILPSGIVPESLVTNDKVYKFLITFTVRKDFDFQGV